MGKKATFGKLGGGDKDLPEGHPWNRGGNTFLNTSEGARRTVPDQNRNRKKGGKKKGPKWGSER